MAEEHRALDLVDLPRLCVDADEVALVEPPRPVEADPAQLCAERLRSGAGGLEQPLHERPRGRLLLEVGVVDGDVRPAQSADEPGVRRARERRVIEELAVRHGRGVLERDPGQRQLLERGLPTRHRRVRAREPGIHVEHRLDRPASAGTRPRTP